MSPPDLAGVLVHLDLAGVVAAHLGAGDLARLAAAHPRRLAGIYSPFVQPARLAALREAVLAVKRDFRAAVLRRVAPGRNISLWEEEKPLLHQVVDPGAGWGQLHFVAWIYNETFASELINTRDPAKASERGEAYFSEKVAWCRVAPSCDDFGLLTTQRLCAYAPLSSFKVPRLLCDYIIPKPEPNDDEEAPEAPEAPEWVAEVAQIFCNNNL